MNEFETLLRKRLQKLREDREKIVREKGPIGFEYAELVWRKNEAETILATYMQCLAEKGASK